MDEELCPTCGAYWDCGHIKGAPNAVPLEITVDNGPWYESQDYASIDPSEMTDLDSPMAGFWNRVLSSDEIKDLHARTLDWLVEQTLKTIREP